MRRGSTAAIVAATVTVMSFCQPTVARPRGDEAHQIIRLHIDSSTELDTLLRVAADEPDVEIWSDAVGLGGVDVRIAPAQKALLEACGLRYDVTIADLQQYYESLFAPSEEVGFFETYRTYDEHVAFLGDLAARYPDLAQLVNLGSSVEGRPLWAIRITGPGVTKPGVLFHGGQHGNELTGTAVVAYMAEHLLAGYDTDVRLHDLVNNVEWFLLPIMNPDGYVRGRRRNAHNVDLNRNWDGPRPDGDPFSEPETTAVRDFLEAHPNIRAYVDFHTYGNMIMWPWGYTNVRSQDNDTYFALGSTLRDRIAEVRNTRYDRIGPLYTTIYPIHGASVDYTYSQLEIWSFTLEVGCCSYAVPPSEILPTAAEIAPVMTSLAEWASDCNGNGILDPAEFYLGMAEDCDGNQTPDECEVHPDFDGDTLVNVCDDDIDNDGVLNAADACDFTPLGLAVDADGRPIGDASGNCDIEFLDYQRFLACAEETAAGTIPSSGLCLAGFDYDGNGRIDLYDYAQLSAAYTGFR